MKIGFHCLQYLFEIVKVKTYPYRLTPNGKKKKKTQSQKEDYSIIYLTCNLNNKKKTFLWVLRRYWLYE